MIKFDIAQGTPKYKQIADRIRHYVTSSQIKAGDRMPTARELSLTLHVNVATVSRAYRVLSREGMLRMSRGSGTYVLGTINHPRILFYRQNQMTVMRDESFLTMSH